MNTFESAATNWVVTPEGLVGCRNQAVGLAEALGLKHVVPEVRKPSSLWQWLLPRNQDLHPPWPDVLISCGRRSVPVSLAIRKASKGRTFTVQAAAGRPDWLVEMEGMGVTGNDQPSYPSF